MLQIVDIDFPVDAFQTGGMPPKEVIMNQSVLIRRIPRSVIWIISIIALVVASIGGSYLTAGLSPSANSLPANQGALNASAASFISPISSTGSVGEKIQAYVENTSSVDHPTLLKLLKAANVSGIDTSSGKELDPSLAFADRTNDGAFMLRVPFKHSGSVLDISGYSVFLDANYGVIGNGEVVFTQLTSSSGRMEMWQGGVLRMSQEASDPQPATSNSAAGISDSNAVPAFSWDVLNRCLLNAGISQWTITLIGIGCALVCGATLGIGCLACVVAIAGIAGTTIGTCVARAMLA